MLVNPELVLVEFLKPRHCIVNLENASFCCGLLPRPSLFHLRSQGCTNTGEWKNGTGKAWVKAALVVQYEPVQCYTVLNCVTLCYTVKLLHCVTLLNCVTLC